jgi:hypothetical protein
MEAGQRRLRSTFPRTFWIGVSLLLLWDTAPVWAHVEGAELAADVTWERTAVKLDLRLAVRELINAEQPIDSVVLPDYTQDPVEVMKRHEEEVLRAFSISYDGKLLAPRLVSSSVQNLVIGVSDEDIVPRQCATYQLEFTGGQSQGGPSQIELEMSMFKLPPEAGFQPTVMCMVTHQVADSDRQRVAVIGHDETLSLKPQWPGKPPEPVAAPGAVAGAIVASAEPVPGTPANRSRGPMIVLGAAAAIAVVLLVVIARKKA